VVEFHVLKDVYVVGEGLVFDRHLRLVDASVAQHEPEHLVAALASLRRCLSLDNVPTERSTTLLCGKIGMGNYGHWMVEMLPAAFLSRQLLIEGSWKVFMPRIYDHMAPIIHDSLSLLGLASEKCIVNDGAPYHFRELVFLSGLSEHGVFYPHAAVECMDALSSGIVPGTAERVWISREGERRSLRHEAAVSAALAERGWQIIRPGQMSLLEQIAVAKGARHIAGVNGAGLTNLGFMAPGGRVTSFMPSLMPDIFYWMLSALRRLDYCEVRCEVSPPCDWHIAWDAQINMPVEEVLAHLGV
jgi:capsular polysaccharide biosynthesis protein